RRAAFLRRRPRLPRAPRSGTRRDPCARSGAACDRGGGDASRNGALQYRQRDAAPDPEQARRVRRRRAADHQHRRLAGRHEHLGLGGASCALRGARCRRGLAFSRREAFRPGRLGRPIPRALSARCGRGGLRSASRDTGLAMTTLNDQVRAFWEAGACGTDAELARPLERRSREWFEAIEENRYRLEPFIHGFAQFTRHRGKKILEVGVGAGTDHLQWARAGCECFGVDLTQEAIDTTAARLRLYGFHSTLQRVDAERLPFPDESFDLVYSWGVIHHSERPEAIVAEVHRVLRPGGLFLGMLYNRRALVTLELWVRHALLAGRPWRSFRDVL